MQNVWTKWEVKSSGLCPQANTLLWPENETLVVLTDTEIVVYDTRGLPNKGGGLLGNFEVSRFQLPQSVSGEETKEGNLHG